MKITAIIPAYNEVKHIADVLLVLKKVNIIDEIIVVSDGSCDGTAEKARSFGVNVIELKNNLGKGGAMKEGLKNCGASIVLFLDADLIGLTEKHIYNLLSPVINDFADMTIGIFANGRLATDLAQKIAPHLSGQRAVKKSVIDNIENMYITRYGIEAALTKYAEINNLRVDMVPLPDMTHHMKEEKLGLAKGFAARLKMYWDILRCMGIHIKRKRAGGKR
ncbi:glucosyl-3-phosphoglycerate synthase [Oxobacter pfennigii]|uniref:Glucosyl-3-phosphoglycerate synthase n=1 Tax=Oxobacter pfennigii TaxID=36849 RepID=A0A0P8WZJ7_9CLOT|nr:glycosyltransferase family 2 protein [Oxobacter pfennigii]KPU43908.1 glucosyl-3-phosphoglycerate synthase [Oxobacter pfennigii]